MLVAMLSAEYPPRPGGIGDYTRRLGLALLERGQQVAVLTIDEARFTIHDLNASTLNPQSAIQLGLAGWSRCPSGAAAATA
jgi:hypothetical protein